MKKSAFIKSTMRQPIRTLALFLLIGLITFAFVSSATEYLIISNVVKDVGGFYNSIGSISPHDASTYDVTKGADLIAQSSRIRFEDRRRIISGVLEGVYNGDVDGFSSDQEGSTYTRGLHINEILFTGELIKREYDEKLGEAGGYVLDFSTEQVLYGYPEYLKQGEKITFLCPIAKSETESSDDSDTDAVGVSVTDGMAYIGRPLVLCRSRRRYSQPER